MSHYAPGDLLPRSGADLAANVRLRLTLSSGSGDAFYRVHAHVGPKRDGGLGYDVTICRVDSIDLEGTWVFGERTEEQLRSYVARSTNWTWAKVIERCVAAAVRKGVAS